MSNFTRSAILKTFDDMLESMPFEKITVSALIKTCNVSRNTFYYHFQDMYDLLDAWLQSEFGKYEIPAGDTDWESRIKALLHACKDNKKKVYHLYNSISRERMERYVFNSTNDRIRSYVQAQAAGKDVSPTRIEGIADICRYAIIGFFLRFLWEGMSADIDSSIDTLSVLFNDIVENTLIKKIG